jgi:GAF domain
MTDPRVNHDSCKALGIASFAVMPLIRDDEVIGIFEIFSNQPRAFQERDLLALERMGEMVNTALDQVKQPRTKAAAAGLAIGAIQVREADPGDSLVGIDAELFGSGEPAAPPKALDDGASGTAEKVDASPLFEARAESTKAVTAGASAAGIGTCTQCGFPVSGGRKLCLDCEAATEKQPTAEPSTSTAPAFLAGLEAEKSGFKHWIISHRYLLGIIAMTLATVLVLLFH